MAHPLPTFPHFRQLPSELRTAIWHEHIANEYKDRVIDLCFSQDGRKNSFRMVCEVPQILHVDQEARKVGVRYYRKAFSSKVTSRVSVGQVQDCYFYFDFDRDILNITTSGTLRQRRQFFQEPTDFKNVQRLMVSDGKEVDTPLYGWMVPSLKELTLATMLINSSSDIFCLKDGHENEYAVIDLYKEIGKYAVNSEKRYQLYSYDTEQYAIVRNLQKDVPGAEDSTRLPQRASTIIVPREVALCKPKLLV